MIDENGFIQPEHEEQNVPEQQPVVDGTVSSGPAEPAAAPQMSAPKAPGAKRNSARIFLVWGLIIGILLGSVVGGIFGNYVVMSNPNIFPWARTTTVNYPTTQTSGSSTVVTSDEQAVENAIRIASPAVVQINTTSVSTVDLPYWFGGQQSQQEEGIGSGFIITPNGYILTNNHVIENATKITVTLKDGREFSGKVVGSDSLSDVAVVKINGTNLPTVALGDSSNLVVGQKVIAIGNPYGLSQTVTTGSVSALERNIQTSSDTTGTSGSSKTLVGVIQTDAAINPGNSGGPLIDLSGRVVGINTMIYQNAQGLGFSVSSNTAKKVYESIIKTGKVTWPALGIQGTTLTDSVAQQYNVKAEAGVYVVAVTSGSGAEAAGIRKGDVITAIDGEKMTTIDQVLAYVRAKNVGDTVKVAVNRNGQSLTMDVVLKALTAQ